MHSKTNFKVKLYLSYYILPLSHNDLLVGFNILSQNDLRVALVTLRVGQILLLIAI